MSDCGADAVAGGDQDGSGRDDDDDTILAVLYSRWAGKTPGWPTRRVTADLTSDDYAER